MKNKLNGLIATTLIIGMTIPQTAIAEKEVRIFINNNPIISDVPPVIEDGRTLVPIRVIAEHFNCEVNWIGEENTAEIKKDDNVLQFPINSDFYIENGKKLHTNETLSKIINNRTFVPLRYVADFLDCVTVWDDNEYAVYIAEYPEYEDNLNILYEFNIIDKEDLVKNEYITVQEALQVLSNILGGSSYSLEEWYRGTTLAPLDYLDDSDKKLLLHLVYHSSVLNTDDATNIKLDNNITNYEALKYVTRMVGNTYGCTDSIEEISFNEKSQTYDRAYEKGLIDKINIDNADLPIKRADFYELIHKALFVEVSRGGAGGIMKFCHADSCFSRIQHKKHPKTEASEPIVHQISVDYTINEDMSVSWTTPDEYKDVITDDSHIEVGLYTEDNEKIGGYMSIGIRTELSPEQMIQWLLKNQTKKAAYLKVRHYNYNMKTNSTDEEWYFDIAMPDIEISFEGEEIKPGTFTAFNREWVPKTITLADGQTFKKGSYYMITSYSHNSRKEEYNHVSSAIWKADEDTEIFDNSDHHRNLNCGGLSLDDMHIQEITVNGNAKSGFKLCVTPESSDIFKVVEEQKQF